MLVAHTNNNNNKTAGPVNCVMSQWSSIGACSVPCGGGSVAQARTILTPASGGGTGCGPESRTVTCEPQPCPVDCGYDWSQWSGCPIGTCGVQMNTRTVSVWYVLVASIQQEQCQPHNNRSTPTADGVQCPASRVQIRACTYSLCYDCNYDVFG